MVLDLTAGGRLTVSPFVNERKLLAMTEMVAGGKLGGYAGERARTDLRETLSTSDAPHSFAHLVNLRNLPQYDEIVPDYKPIVQDEEAPDFDPIRFFALRNNWKNLENGKDNDGNRVAPLVPELDTYQYAFGYTQLDASVAVEKRGFKVGWSLERGVSDPFGLINRFPGDMLKVGVKTDAFVVSRALTSGVTSNSQLTSATTDPVSGDAIPANPLISGKALRAAIRVIAGRTDADGNKIPLPSGFHVVVPSGTAEDVQMSIALARGTATIVDGSIIYNAAGLRAFDSLGRIKGVIEDEFLDADHWYLVPDADAVEVPALVRVRLAGYTAPEVYVSNWNGAPVLGGASNSPFQAYSFDNDSLDLKFRQFTNAAVFSEESIAWSDGSES